ncbi:unnamed protein product [Adineta steineri]|uniref:Uncharacterized protein n=1 Tax=Adineta steineri TaxID=433720 RepID=A0A816AW87_9BILA|nr:unnamed protein product [Adineta steineri]CAF1600911.1 unnamed protein product [Adineta steineri]
MMNNTQTMIPPQQLWRKKFPAIISGIFSFIQFVLMVIIIGCEVGSMLIDIVTATIYVGLWASLFFMIAWISQATSSCCCRNRGCATYTLIAQCISLFFAMCIIGFDAYYIISPTTCFFSSYICSSSAPARGLFYSNENFNNIKIPLIKGQLAAGCLMFIICLVYIVIYIITSIRVHRAKQPRTIYPQVQNPFTAPSTISNGILTAPPITNYSTPTTLYNSEIVCPTCKTVMNMTPSKRPPM